MAVYKVPQDVEADDKLLGPFSFKQFIFLIIAVASIAVAYGLSRVMLPLALIPVPLIIFFGTLALPLRKEQPMEVYLAAVISFIVKPKVRIWEPDGVEAMIEVTAPKTEDKQYGKGYSQEEVQKRLSYLANLVDSRGWSVRGVSEPDSPMRADLYNEAQAVDDPLDDYGVRAQQIDTLLTKTHNERRQQIITQMQQPQVAPAPVAPQSTPVIEQPAPATEATNYTVPISAPYTPMSVFPAAHPDEDTSLVINPYPTMSQSIITPLDERPAPPPSAPEPPAPEPPAASHEPVSPAIMDLANNHGDLSVETLQREAQRIKKKEEEEQEVVISLR